MIDFEPDWRRGVLMAVSVLCAGCVRHGGRSSLALEEATVFTMEYGNFEDELKMYDFNEVGDIDISLAMRNGFFYIANGASKKIMELNSYGDLLALYYNEDANPVPSFMRDAPLSAATSTRKAVVYPFNKITSVAVDSRRYMYVVDELPFERQEMDKENKLVLSQIVLRFDENGTFLDYLGQQGPGGTPFPYVRDVYVTRINELVVVCTTGAGPVVYWFSSSGYLMYTVPIEEGNVPNPYESDVGESWFEVENVIPDYHEKRLYVKADYFVPHIDDSSHMQSGIDYTATLLYTLDVETGIYGRPLSVMPFSEQPREGFSTAAYEIPYDFLGVSEDGWLFFIISTEDGFTLQLVQENGQKVMTRRLRLNHRENLFYTFGLSNTGILSVLLVQRNHAVVQWWRTDSLIQTVIAG